ncbi:MAG TPA: hypothetical protein VJN92_14460 [Candidatus Acidoferrum sp.]|nr:hypothetical protein [Candidatus Acidoferrum sp.]
MTEHKEACCTSPSAICYWFAASLIAWGILSFIGIYRHPLHASAAPAILFAMAIGCGASWIKNRSFHCGITGPLFFIAGIALLLSELRATHFNVSLVWPVVCVGVGIAFLLEWRYAGRITS